MFSTPSGGVLEGNAITPVKFQGVTTLAQIEAYGLIRPTVIDKSGKGLSPQQKAAHELHSVTNRAFDKARLDNAHDYSGYIEAVELHGRPGGTPAITLYHRESLVADPGGKGIVIPYGAGIVAIDGETQTEARYILSERQPETRGNPIAVTLYHGISVDTAMQILHDYNTKGLAWNESKAARFNRTGQISLAANAVIAKSGVKASTINYRGDQSTRKHIVSLKQLATGLIGYQLSGKGSEVAVTASHFKRFNEASAIHVPDAGIDRFAEILKRTAQDPKLGKAPAQVWQIAGVLLSKNQSPSALNWEGALDAYERTKSGKRGGPRLSVKERLRTIELAMSAR